MEFTDKQLIANECLILRGTIGTRSLFGRKQTKWRQKEEEKKRAQTRMNVRRTPTFLPCIDSLAKGAKVRVS